MDIKVESIINIFTIIDGKIKLLVNNNQLLKIECLDELDIVNNNYINNNMKINNLSLEQCYTFSKKKEDKLVFSVLYVDIVNIDDIKLIEGLDFIELDKIDRNDIYIEKSLEYLKKKITLNSTMKKLYPGEFILPEMQRIYEQLFEIKIDRRNFRKKLIKLDVIEVLDKLSSGKNGRPAKLYKFKDIKENKILF